ncbi:hypothetical protein ACOMHN_043661 [Nucella lapillus]
MADDRVTPLEQLMTLGRDMGYSDEGLRKFIEGQQKVEREERAERRRAEAENRKMESEMENRKIEAEAENRKLESEMENRKIEAEAENRKLESEMENRKIEAENRKIESEMENRKIEAAMENRKIEAEMENRKMEAEMEKLRLEMSLREKELEIRRVAIESEDSDAPSSIPGHHRPNHAPRPQLPKFSEGSDSMDAYISRFEVFARSQGWPEREWAMILSALLTGKALNIFSTLPAVQQSDFDCLKKALLQGFDLTEEAFRKKFRSVRLQAGETYIQFGARLEHYFQKWVELSGTGEEFLELKELILREQVLTGCGPELTIHLRERQPKTTAELLQMAEIYREARADTKSCVRQVSSTGERGDKKPDELPRKSAQPTKGVSEQRSLGQREIRECFLCHKRGHIARDCRTRVQRAAAMERTTECRVERPVVKEGVRDGEEEVQPVASTVEQAVSGVQDIGILGSLPVKEGWIGQCKVKVLRDTGCSCGVVRASLVKEEDLTGQVQTCTLIDGTKREFPVAELVVQTPYFSGKLSALVMESPIYELIVGNVPGARDPGDPLLLTAETAAVQTRSHRAEKGVKPLLVSARKAGIEASPEEVRKAQEGDPSLEKLWKLARGEKRQEVRGGKADFQVKNGLLHRMFTKTKTGKVTSQLVVPACFRETVMSVGHESLMAGHLGISKTADRVLSSFHWPGAMADLKRYCASCDACQRSATRGAKRKAPLKQPPLIDTPFRRVAIDLIGPIAPCSGSGHRYILTMVDYATRYPEAVALKRIETEVVAEGLVEVFSRVGVPSEVLSDRGSQFTSGVMREVSRLLGVTQLYTTPYHPQSNGLVERFNGTLKGMLKKLCEERPSDWDRYIPAALFAYREAPQESTGFSPFELLYGRTVKGPVSILKELWSKEQETEEVKTTYQYVVDLRNRLEETCQFAMESLQQARVSQKRQFDKRVRRQNLKQGDKVLLLLPTDHNKILMHWKGPFDITEKVSHQDYRIDVNGKQKLFHANLLRKYTQRESQPATLAAVIDGGEGDPEVEGEILIPEFRSGETYRDVSLHEGLSGDKKEEARRLLRQFSESLTDKPGKTTLETYTVELTTKQPVHVKAYPIPYATRQVVEEEVEKMLELGVIEPSRSPYSAPVVIVRKKSGEHRFCVDYRRLNNVTKVDAEVIPNVEDLFAQISTPKSKYFTRIDLSKGYWQIALSEDSKEATAFSTPTGLFQWRVLPFGMVNAPAVFTRMMRKLLKGLKGVENFMDDILIASETWEEHMSQLAEVLLRLRRANLTARPTKCQIGYPDLEFLGFVVGENTKQPEKSKIERMLSSARPKSKTEVRSLLGLIGFYREFVPNFAAITSPLSDLTKKGQPPVVQWTEAAEKALKTVKERLGTYPILKLPDMSKQFTLRTDASGVGLGAVLLQEYDGHVLMNVTELNGVSWFISLTEDPSYKAGSPLYEWLNGAVLINNTAVSGFHVFLLNYTLDLEYIYEHWNTALQTAAIRLRDNARDMDVVTSSLSDIHEFSMDPIPLPWGVVTSMEPANITARDGDTLDYDVTYRIKTAHIPDQQLESPCLTLSISSVYSFNCALEDDFGQRIVAIHGPKHASLLRFTTEDSVKEEGVEEPSEYDSHTEPQRESGRSSRGEEVHSPIFTTPHHHLAHSPQTHGKLFCSDHMTEPESCLVMPEEEDEDDVMGNGGPLTLQPGRLPPLPVLPAPLVNGSSPKRSRKGRKQRREQVGLLYVVLDGEGGLMFETFHEWELICSFCLSI